MIRSLSYLILIIFRSINFKPSYFSTVALIQTILVLTHS
jgi:hypothetical protein